MVLWLHSECIRVNQTTLEGAAVCVFLKKILLVECSGGLHLQCSTWRLGQKGGWFLPNASVTEVGYSHVSQLWMERPSHGSRHFGCFCVLLSIKEGAGPPPCPYLHAPPPPPPAGISRMVHLIGGQQWPIQGNCPGKDGRWIPVVPAFMAAPSRCVMARAAGLLGFGQVTP